MRRDAMRTQRTDPDRELRELTEVGGMRRDAMRIQRPWRGDDSPTHAG